MLQWAKTAWREVSTLKTWFFLQFEDWRKIVQFEDWRKIVQFEDWRKNQVAVVMLELKSKDSVSASPCPSLLVTMIQHDTECDSLFILHRTSKFKAAIIIGPQEQPGPAVWSTPSLLSRRSYLVLQEPGRRRGTYLWNYDPHHWRSGSVLPLLFSGKSVSILWYWYNFQLEYDLYKKFTTR